MTEKITRERLEQLYSYTSDPEFIIDPPELRAAITLALQALEMQPRQEQWTYGHCAEKKKPSGCQLHNLHCQYPDCDRKPAT